MPNVTIHPARVTDIPALAAVVDGYPEERHRLSASTGDEPLEDGAVITDHAVARKETLELTGWVSNLTAEGQARPQVAWATLRRLNQTVEPVRIVTPWGVYPEMIMLEADAENQGGAMRFTLQFAEIQRVGIVVGEIPPERASGPAQDRTTEVRRGKVAAPEIPEAADTPLAPGILEDDPDFIPPLTQEQLDHLAAREAEFRRIDRRSTAVPESL